MRIHRVGAVSPLLSMTAISQEVSRSGSRKHRALHRRLPCRDRRARIDDTRAAWNADSRWAWRRIVVIGILPSCDAAQPPFAEPRFAAPEGSMTTRKRPNPGGRVFIAVNRSKSVQDIVDFDDFNVVTTPE
jgi:hypothetical protein